MMSVLTFSTAGVFVLADWMVMAKLLEDVPALLTALPVCVPDESTIVTPVVNNVEPYAAPSVEQGDDDDPHDVAVDPPVVFTYRLFAVPPPPEPVGHVVDVRESQVDCSLYWLL